MNLCRKLRFFNIILEGDALQIVCAVKLIDENWSKIGHLIDGIKEGLRKLRSWRIEHDKRDANSAVHSLAREVL